jgi:hypothetical protein
MEQKRAILAMNKVYKILADKLKQTTEEIIIT